MTLRVRILPIEPLRLWWPTRQEMSEWPMRLCLPDGYDDLSDGKDNKIDVSKVDVSMDGIELEDREFIAAIEEKREPNGSLQQLQPCMHVLGKLEKIIDPQRKAHA